MSNVSINNLKEILNKFKDNVLDIKTYKGIEDGTVKKSELTVNIEGIDSAENFSLYMKDRYGNIGIKSFPSLIDINIDDITPTIYKNMESGVGSIVSNIDIDCKGKKLYDIFDKNNTTLVTTSINNSTSSHLILTIDFGEILTFNSMGFKSSYGCPKVFTISTSDDAIDYTLKETVDKYIKNWVGGESLVLLDNVITTRYLKIECSSVFNGVNRYQFSNLNFYYDKNFIPSIYKDYLNKSGIPYYYKSETYNSKEIDDLVSEFYNVNADFTLTSDCGGTYTNSNTGKHFTTSLNSSGKQPIVNITFDKEYKINAFSMKGSGYGGVNDFDVYYSDDGTSYNLLLSVINANIYTKDEMKFVCFKNIITSKYLRFILKKNVSGNRYEFNDLVFYYDKKIDATPSQDYINKYILDSAEDGESEMTEEDITNFINDLWSD